MTACHSLFGRWLSGSEHEELNPDPAPKNTALPFWVLIRGESWIPVSALVFASDVRHAEARVRHALALMIKEPYRSPLTGEETVSARIAQRLLLELESGVLKLTVQPYDTDKMACKVNWASNGGL